MTDLILINPGGRQTIYQDLGDEFTAIEPPLWCRLIAGYCSDRQHSTDILDAEALGMGPNAVAAEIARRKPTLVGMVVYGHQPSASTQQMVSAGEICRAIKAGAPDQKIIILGGHVAALPIRTMREETVDYACNSEGPVTVHELLLCLVSCGPLNTVPGLVWRDGIDIKVNPAPPLVDLSQLHGNTWARLPMKKYRAHNWQCFDDLTTRQPYASIYTSLGCPFKCSFCCINAPFGEARYRMRGPLAVIAEVDQLYRDYGVTTFKIVDEMFVLNPKHYLVICEGLAALPYAHELNFWAYARIDTVKAGHLPLLRQAGIRWLALGIESGSEHVRDGASKSFGAKDITDVVRAIQAAGISVIGNFIYGLPDDTLGSMRATLDLAKALKCEFTNHYSAMCYPGSRLYDETPEADRPKSWAAYSQHSYETQPLPTATLTAAEVLAFRDRAFLECFTDPDYLAMVEAKFGKGALAEIERMTAYRLPRKLLAARRLVAQAGVGWQGAHHGTQRNLTA